MIVIDCSAVVDALSMVAGTEDLRALLGSEDLHAPGLIDAEVVSALRGLILGRHLTVPRAHDLLTDYDDIPLERWSTGDALRRRAFALRDNLTAYDATYVALAEALDCPLITRDKRLGRTRGHQARIDVV